MVKARMRGIGWGRVGAVVIGLLAGATATAGAEPADPRDWGAARGPVAGEASSLGGAAAGCLVGAVALDRHAPGLEVLRPERNRFWAHPRTVDFVHALGRRAQTAGLGPVLVGDMSQPRGGPMAFGHGSHQTGLDVDIWFRLPHRALTEAERARPQPVSMVKANRVNPKTWGAEQLRLLELAANTPDVDRVFVNPAIKAAVCKATARTSPAWVAKLRPWWGHDEHFHVRLSCTEGDANCQSQAPVPAGDGCGDELASWLTHSSVLPKEVADKPNTRRPNLPSSCQAVLAQPGVTRSARR